MVELHGNLHAGISSRIDNGIDEAQRDVFYGGQVRSWLNDRTQVFLPGVDEDVIPVPVLENRFTEENPDAVLGRHATVFARLVYPLDLP